MFTSIVSKRAYIFHQQHVSPCFLLLAVSRPANGAAHTRKFFTKVHRRPCAQTRTLRNMRDGSQAPRQSIDGATDLRRGNGLSVEACLAFECITSKDTNKNCSLHGITSDTHRGGKRSGKNAHIGKQSWPCGFQTTSVSISGNSFESPTRAPAYLAETQVGKCPPRSSLNSYIVSLLNAREILSGRICS